MKTFLAILLFTLAACSATGSIDTSSPAAVAQTSLQAVESAYQAAAQAELVYLKLPTCGTPAATTALCATPEKRAQIKAFDAQAYADIVAARAAADAASTTAPTALTTANQSVTNLTASIPK